jgi:hypothetical protein
MYSKKPYGNQKETKAKPSIHLCALFLLLYTPYAILRQETEMPLLPLIDLIHFPKHS